MVKEILLVVYKKKRLTLFSNLLEKLKFDSITILMNLKVIEQPQEEISTKKNEKIQ